MPGGPAELELARLVRSYSAQVRALIAISGQAAALLVTPHDRIGTSLLALVLVSAWLAVVTVRLSRGPARWVLVADVVVLSALCLLQPVLDVPVLVTDESGWVFLAAEAGLIAHQWQFDRRPALIATLATVPFFVAGSLLMGALPLRTVVLLAAWLVLASAVSGWIRELFRIAARDADASSTAHDRAQREIAVATALRESELEHLATLHDTVAATLMMVGRGAVISGTAVRQQATRDLAVLSAAPRPDRVDVRELEARLAEVIRASPLTVDFTRRGPTVVPPGAVGDALAGALGESLRNVTRHAGVDRAEVELDSSGEQIVVRVQDAGRGFAPEAGPGRGIRHSITARMLRAGGQALVTSSPSGVSVELRWPGRTSSAGGGR